jgi:hypothetical protein
MTDPARSAVAFEVNFTRPSIFGGFGAKPQPGWAIMGKGAVLVNGANLTLKGRRPRPFQTSAKHEISIQLQDVINVIRDGRFIQCHVRFPYTKERVLQMWAADADAAEQIVKLLPTEHNLAV